MFVSTPDAPTTLDGSAMRIGIVQSRFNDGITNNLAQACLDELAARAGVGPQVVAITERAMRGELDFAAALRERVAMFRGKPRARGSITVFEPEMDMQIRDRRALYQDLANAIRNGTECAPSFRDKLKIHYIWDAAEQSVREKRWVKVDYSKLGN